MKPLSLVRSLFWIACLYESLLGLAFIVAAPKIYTLTGITPPNHWGYLHFPAGVLVIFGFMFFQIARDPVENRGLVPYGILLKICYVATVAWHWYSGGIPDMWKWFALADAVFAILFFWAMVEIEKAVAQSSTPAGAAPHAA
jgi:hypothetical protein